MLKKLLMLCVALVLSVSAGFAAAVERARNRLIGIDKGFVREVAMSCVREKLRQQHDFGDVLSRRDIRRARAQRLEREMCVKGESVCDAARDGQQLSFGEPRVRRVSRAAERNSGGHASVVRLACSC